MDGFASSLVARAIVASAPHKAWNRCVWVCVSVTSLCETFRPYPHSVGSTPKCDGVTHGTPFSLQLIAKGWRKPACQQLLQ